MDRKTKIYIGLGTTFALIFGFLIGIGTSYEEKTTCPTCTVCSEPIVCPKGVDNSTNTTIRYSNTTQFIERCTNYNVSNITTNLLYVQLIQKKDKQLEECYNLTATNKAHNTSTRLARCLIYLEQIKEVLE